MGATWMDTGIVAFNASGGNMAATDKKFFLFVNNHTPVVTDTISAYTEPSNSGYSRMGAMGWISPGSSGGVLSGTLYSPTWTFTANAFAESIYGWGMLVNPGSGLILACAKLFAAPHLIPALGESFPLTFTFSLRKLP